MRHKYDVAQFFKIQLRINDKIKRFVNVVCLRNGREIRAFHAVSTAPTLNPLFIFIPNEALASRQCFLNECTLSCDALFSESKCSYVRGITCQLICYTRLPAIIWKFWYFPSLIDVLQKFAKLTSLSLFWGYWKENYIFEVSPLFCISYLIVLTQICIP